MTRTTHPASRRRRRAALVATGLLVGGATAGVVGVTAATAATPATHLTAAASSSATTPPAPNHQSTPVRSDEKAVSSTVAAKLKAAALKAVPGGTVYRIETDAGDGAYEAHMTKADGIAVTVKFDKNLAVTKVESGMGTGDPAPTGQGAPDGAPSGAAPSGAPAA